MFGKNEFIITVVNIGPEVLIATNKCLYRMVKHTEEGLDICKIPLVVVESPERKSESYTDQSGCDNTVKTEITPQSEVCDHDYQIDGVDLMPMLSQQASQTDRTFYWRVNRSNYRMRAIRHGDWKYIDDAGTMDLLFDLKNDISERKNLCYQNKLFLNLL